MQHPAYGPGEDWNADGKVLRHISSLQHPAYGPGEDWNNNILLPLGNQSAASGLRAG